jgi:hypothetical protein
VPRRWLVVGAVLLVAGLVGTMMVAREAPSALSIGATAAPIDPTITAPVDPQDFARRRLPPVETTTARPGEGALLPGAPDLTIVAADDTGLQLLDTDTGDLRRIAIRRPAAASLSETLFIVGGGIVIDADTDVVVVPQSTPRPSRIAAGHRAIPTIDDSSVWVFDNVTPYVIGTASRIGLDGTVHAQVELPAIAKPLVGTADGLIVGAPGAVSFVANDGQRRLVARGMAVATDGQRLAWLQCSDDLACVINIGTIDDPTQVRSVLDPAVLPAGFFGLPTGTFSPDGRWLALPLYRSRSSRGLEDVTVAIIDTATGTEAHRVDGSSLTPYDTPLAWSPDSAWLVFVSGIDIRAWRAADGRTVTIDTRLRSVRALAVR